MYNFWLSYPAPWVYERDTTARNCNIINNCLQLWAKIKTNPKCLFFTEFLLLLFLMHYINTVQYNVYEPIKMGLQPNVQELT